MRAVLTALTAGVMLVATGVATAATVPATTESGAATSGARSDSTVKVDVKRHTLAGKTVAINGKVRPGGRRVVTVRAAGKKVATVRSKPNGKFRTRWSTPRTGTFEVKAVAQQTLSAERAGSARKQVNVYRSAVASYYGPGLYGNPLGCGGTLTPSTMGVAHKTLPCGSKVTIRHGNRTVRVRVIDRGPYAGNREFDLTAATKAKLGFGSTGTILVNK